MLVVAGIPIHSYSDFNLLFMRKLFYDDFDC